MRILGIDPGLAIVGFGLIEAETGKTQMLQYGAVTTPAGLPLAARLVQLERDMEELIAQLRPEAIAVEELFSPTTSPPASPSRTRAASSSAPRRRAGYRSLSTRPCRSSRRSSAMALPKSGR